MKMTLTPLRAPFRCLTFVAALSGLTGCWVEVANVGETGGVVRSTAVLQGSGAPRIQCGAGYESCESAFIPGVEQLVAEPQPGYVFDAWSGACADETSATCTLDVTLTSWFDVTAHFNYQPVSIDPIADQVVNQNFAPFTLQASASSTAGAVTYSVTNSRPDAVTVDVDSLTGELNVTPLTDQFGNADIEVFASVAGNHSSSTRFSLVVSMPEKPVFACGTGVETETGDTIPGSYTLFEGGQSRPIAISPNGRYLFVTNTPANCLEIYNIEQDEPQLISSVAVGLEPVAVAAKSDTEVWVVNHLSDSVSVVDIRHRPHVKQTLLVGDEPRDIVFGGPNRDKAFISAAFRGQNHPQFDIEDLFTPSLGRGDVWVFDSNNPGTGLGGTPLTIINLFTDALNALAVTEDGSTVYAAGLMTGNQTTVIDEASAANKKPVPHANVEGATAPKTGLIVKYDGTKWEDETGRDWSSEIPFSLPDNDVFTIDATPAVPVLTDSHSHVGTTLFGMAINPTTGELFVSNTNANNEVRFEGHGSISTTVRGNLAENRVTIIDGNDVTPYPLNSHINFNLPFGSQVSPADKSMSISQPGAMTYYNNALWVLGFGSSKVHIYSDPSTTSDTDWFESAVRLAIPGGGPSGIAIQDYRGRAYIYSRFSHSITLVSTKLLMVLNTFDLFTPEPASVIAGRPFLYDAQLTSGNGTAACASCHIFADIDGLAWDLGDPDGQVADNPNEFLPRAVQFGLVNNPKFHPMKGPMTTQTLRGMANHGPLHWRGDRTGKNRLPGETIEEAAFKEFNAAFVGLIGRDSELSQPELDQFTDFAMQLTPPPNPIRRLDNSLTATQAAGADIYFNRSNTTLLGGCNDCHRLDPSQNLFGTSGQSTFEGTRVSQLFKIPHTRNAYQKVGKFGATESGLNEDHSGPQIKGFGFLHDGSVDTLNNFFDPSTFNFPQPRTTTRRQVSEFVFVFDSNLKPIVGQQVTLNADNASTVGARIDLLISRALAGDCDLIAWSSTEETNGAISGRLLPNGMFKLSIGAQLSDSAVRQRVQTTGEPVTYTCVPPGSGVRLSQVP